MAFRKKIFISLLILTSSFFFEMAKAAVSPRSVIPTVSDPGLFQQRLLMPKTPVYQPRKTAIQAPEAEKKQTAGAEKIKFKFTKAIFKGNTVISTETLQAIFKDIENKVISLADLQNRVQEITVLYRKEGYILSRAILPPQTIKNGVVTIQIIEGFVDQVNVAGDPGRLKKILEHFGNKIKASRPLNFHLLEREMLLMGDLPGVDVRAVLNPSKHTPGAADLTLMVDRTWYNAYYTYDNYGTRYLGPLENTVGASVYSLFRPGDSNSIRLVKTTQAREMTFGEATHSQMLGSNGGRWGMGVSISKTIPGFVLDPLFVVGRSTLIYGNVSYPMIRSRVENFSVNAVANYQNVFSTISNANFYQDRLRTLVIGGNYDRIDHWNGYNTVSLNLEHGFDIMGAAQHVNQSRLNGEPNFTKISSNLSRLQLLSERFSFYAAFQGQYAMMPLLATEQFGYGGPDFGRGYDPSEIVGDDGMAGKVELRMQTNPGYKFLQTVQYYGFYDAGIIWNRDAVGLPAKQDATSTGVGARISFVPEISANVYVAKPLTKPVATLATLGEDPNKFLIFFQILASI